MELKKVFATAVLSVVTLATSAGAAASYELLGHTRLTDRPDRDVIQVNSCAGRNGDRIAAVRFYAAAKSSFIQDITVTFGNRDRDYIAVRENIRAGGWSRLIDLNGRNRCVRSIQIRGESSEPGKSQSQVRVYGLAR